MNSTGVPTGGSFSLLANHILSSFAPRRGLLISALGMVLTAAFNGAGDTWTPTLINLGVFWAFEIPMAWFLSTQTPLGPRGVFWALTIAYSGLAVVSAVLFRRGSWKARTV